MTLMRHSPDTGHAALQTSEAVVTHAAADAGRGRCLIVGPLPPPRGGVSVHIERLMSALQSEGISCAVLNEALKPTPGVPHLRSIWPWTYLGILWRADVVHIQSSNHFVRLFHALAAGLLGCRSIHTVHSSRGSALALAILRIACRLGHACICVSEPIAAGLGVKAAIIPAFIAPADDNSVPPEIADWLAAQTDAGRGIIAMNASNTARLRGVDLYGLDMIVDALRDPRLRERFSAIVCVSKTGPNEGYLSALQERARASGLSDRLKFAEGEIQFASLLRRCDVFLRPTITDGDALSLREALWWGVPAVASDAAIRPEGTHIFPSRDCERMVEAILAASATRVDRSRRQDFADDVVRIYREQLAWI